MSRVAVKALVGALVVVVVAFAVTDGDLQDGAAHQVMDASRVDGADTACYLMGPGCGDALNPSGMSDECMYTVWQTTKIKCTSNLGAEKHGTLDKEFLKHFKPKFIAGTDGQEGCHCISTTANGEEVKVLFPLGGSQFDEQHECDGPGLATAKMECWKEYKKKRSDNLVEVKASTNSVGYFLIPTLKPSSNDHFTEDRNYKGGHDLTCTSLEGQSVLCPSGDQESQKKAFNIPSIASAEDQAKLNKMLTDLLTNKEHHDGDADAKQKALMTAKALGVKIDVGGKWACKCMVGDEEITDETQARALCGA